MTTLLTGIWITFQLLIGYNLILPLILFLIYLILPRKEQASNVPEGKYDYAIIVTAYEQVDLVPAVVESILKLNYENYVVYIVADKCDVSQLKFDDERVVVLRPPHTLASNTRSHFFAIGHFIRPHNVLTIIDSDNLVDLEYLNELNKSFETGVSAVQGVRKAKNLDTTYACLDAARDIYYHYYDGKLLYELGSSATLAGSGMAFKTSLYRECLGHLDITGAGFDKVLQKEILTRGHRIAFNEHAVVYDEKTSASSQLVKQRARWMNTWFKYSWFGLPLCLSGIIRFNRNKLLFGMTLLRPPLFIVLLISTFFVVANLWVNTTASFMWVLGLGCFVAGFMLAILTSKPDKRIVRSLIGIPRFMFFQVKSLLWIKKANSISVATHHYSNTTIDDISR